MAKRKTGEEPDVVSRSDLDGILADFETGLVSRIATNIAKDSQQELHRALTAYDARVSKRFEANEAALAAIRADQTKLEQQQREFAAQLERVSTALEVVEKFNETHDMVHDVTFYRATDPTIIRVNTKEAVPLAELEKAVRAFLKDHVDDQLYCVEQVYDTVPTRFFVVKFTGANRRAASLRVSKALGACRKKGGGWEQLAVTAPSGTVIPYYMSEDKSPKQIAQEIRGKKLLRIIEKELPERKFVLHRREGVIFHNSNPILRVVVESRDDSRVEFEEAHFTELSLDRDSIRDAFNTAIATMGSRNKALVSSKWCL